MPLVMRERPRRDLPVGDIGVTESPHHADIGAPAAARAVLEDHVREIARAAGRKFRSSAS